MLACGIDIGSTNLKVALVDESCRPVWLRSLPTPRCQDDGRPAVDGQEMLGLIERLMLEGWQATGQGQPLAAICTTGVGEDGFHVDAALRPLSAAIAWFDRSATADAAFIRRHAADTTCTGIIMDPTRTGARWRWWARTAPQTVARAHCWLSLVDFPAAVWSGRAFISETLAVRSACYDVERRQWNQALLKICTAPDLPPVLRAGTVVGDVSSPALLAHGLVDAHTRIVVGGHDHPVAASYIQRIHPLARTDSVGTANVIYGQTPLAKVPGLDADIAFTVPLQANSGLACLGVFEFAAAMQTLERKGIDIQAMLAAAHMPDHPTDGHRGNCSDDNPSPRQIFEHAGFAARWMFERMRAAGVPDGPIFATGGWSRSRSLLELRASIYGQPIHTVDELEPAAVGAALIGLDACGHRIDLGHLHPCIVEPVPAWADVYADAAPPA